jgi:altronate dehydratase
VTTRCGPICAGLRPLSGRRQWHKTSDLSDSQPTKGTSPAASTIEEKALGNIQKIGRKCVVDSVLDKAEVPSGPGLWFMDSSSAAAEMGRYVRLRAT